mgnify:CR=1 FL=1|tara:strand:- start:841 stop:1575 length:735 start_codon:yes stop_codon:yes gene_type:complete
MSKPILQVRNAVKRFGGLIAVNDVSFSVQDGQIFGIAGPNGSGKSTLFNLISGIPFAPTKGEIEFEQQRIENWSAHRIARAGLSRTFQKDAEFSDLNAHETVSMSAVYCSGLQGSALKDRCNEALDRVQFKSERLGIKTADLSIYEKKQLMIASALASHPRVLLLDEPASGLARPEISELDALLKSLNRSGVTILIIEHVLSLLLSVSERLLVLNQGRVLTEGEPGEVIKNPAVIEAYLGGQVT